MALDLRSFCGLTARLFLCVFTHQCALAGSVMQREIVKIA